MWLSIGSLLLDSVSSGGVFSPPRGETSAAAPEISSPVVGRGTPPSVDW